jgi:hypothetical protein
MNTYKWTCKGCETPNIFNHDPDEEGQVALSCVKCGTPGVFEPKERVVLHYERGEPFPTGLDYCSTSVYPGQLMDSSYSIPSRPWHRDG